MASKQAAQRPKKQGANIPKRSKAIRGTKPANVERSPVHPTIREADFLATVTELATLCGWLVYHTYDSRRSQAGFPDLVLVRADSLIFAELKTAKGTIKPIQRKWLDTLAAVAKTQPDVAVYLWRPEDWRGIEKILAG